MLVVDDNEVNLLVAKTTLNQYGIVAEAVQSGALALEKLENTTFDLVILDCIMPEMNGHETAKRIRALSGARAKTPIIAYTSNSPESVREEFADVDVTDVLIKPLDTIELTKVLLKYLPSEKLLDKEDVLKELAAIGAAVESIENTEKSQLQLALEQVPELDYMTGLHFASDNEENFFKVVSTASTSMKNIAANIGEFAGLLRVGQATGGYDIAAFRIDAHSMKGVCACIGLDSLSKQSAELERFAIDGADFTALTGELADYSRRLAETGSAISAALSSYKQEEEDSADIIRMEPAQYLALWKETMEYVRCFEIDEIREGLTKLRASAEDAAVRAKLKEALEASEVFDYGKVAEILRENIPG